MCRLYQEQQRLEHTFFIQREYKLQYIRVNCSPYLTQSGVGKLSVVPKLLEWNIRYECECFETEIISVVYEVTK